MLCLVKQPNAVILEVVLDHKSKGQECLDKVCQMLDIIEVDYFGLQYFGQHGELLWLNLRNPVKQQLTGAPPYRLHLKVKFCVPPHLLLQETTRHQFFLNLVRDLRDGKLRVPDCNVALRLTALVAQSELGNLDALPDQAATALLAYPKWLPGCLFESCLEASEVASPLFARKGKRRKHHSGASEPDTSSETEEPPSPCEHDGQRDFAPSPPPMLPCERCGNDKELPQLCSAVMQIHKELCNMKPAAARYLFLKEVSNLDDFGVEYFAVRSNSGPEELFRLGVGPKGVTVALYEDPTKLKHSISYSSIHIATHSGRCLFLTYIEGSGELPLGFKCESGMAANAIYRAVTEKHAFYSCETVRNAVTSQFIRDLKGTIVSLFNENSALGKNYVFDIRRTCREVYDHTRRALFQLERKSSSEELLEESAANANAESGAITTDNGCLRLSNQDRGDIKCGGSCCKDVKAKLASLQDSMLCRVCMDADVSTFFSPCRHVVTCSSCAPLCDTCPLCRTLVQTSQHIYLPLRVCDTTSVRP